MENIIIGSYKKLALNSAKQHLGYVDMQELYTNIRETKKLSLVQFKSAMVEFYHKHNQKDFVFERGSYARNEVVRYAFITNNHHVWFYMRANPYQETTNPKLFSRNLNDAPVKEQNELIDHIIGIAMALHISAMQVAEKLEMPDEIIWMLRNRSPRAAMTNPCQCPECKTKE